MEITINIYEDGLKLDNLDQSYIQPLKSEQSIKVQSTALPKQIMEDSGKRLSLGLLAIKNIT